jgi:hypothetical protein
MSVLEKDLATGGKPDWHLAPPFGWRALAVLLVVVTLLGLSAQRVELDRFLRLTGEAIAAQVGLTEKSASFSRWPSRSAPRSPASPISTRRISRPCRESRR